MLVVDGQITDANGNVIPVASPRISFQIKYYIEVGDPLSTLNIGCADDPVGLENAMHVDIDDWSKVHKRFTQSDAHSLPEDWTGKWKLVILGDILEHVLDPEKVVSEAMRVTAVGGYLVMTIFEEWRLPDYGQHIEEAHELADEENVKLGYKDREDYQQKVYPNRIGVDDNENPHLCHINQFSDKDMDNMLTWMVHDKAFEAVETLKVYEQVQDGHDWYNWLFAFRRVK